MGMAGADGVCATQTELRLVRFQTSTVMSLALAALALGGCAWQEATPPTARERADMQRHILTQRADRPVNY